MTLEKIESRPARRPCWNLTHNVTFDDAGMSSPRTTFASVPVSALQYVPFDCDPKEAGHFAEKQTLMLGVV